MSEQSLKTILTEAMKDSMRQQDKQRLNALRLILAAIKQQEVDTRKDADDEQVLLILDKLIKQRRDAASQYHNAARAELAAQEEYEIKLIEEFLPAQLDANEIQQMIQAALQQVQASSMQDMGKVMAVLKPQLQGRADIASVSQQVKTQLTT